MQTGHRRRIPSAGSAQSASSLLCATESGIKTIVQLGALPEGTLHRPDSQTGPSSPCENLNWDRISNPRYASHSNLGIGRLRTRTERVELAPISKLVTFNVKGSLLWHCRPLTSPLPFSAVHSVADADVTRSNLPRVSVAAVRLPRYFTLRPASMMIRAGVSTCFVAAQDGQHPKNTYPTCDSTVHE